MLYLSFDVIYPSRDVKNITGEVPSVSKLHCHAASGVVDPIWLGLAEG